MAKQALLDVLDKTIGKYVVDLDPQSLNVAVWSGKIHLNALQVDVDAVNRELDRQALAVPLRVVHGSFESLDVNVPWTNLMSKPVVATARGLHVVVEPHDRTSLQDFLHGEPERAANIKQARVQNLQGTDDFRQQTNALRKLAEEDLEDASSGDAGQSSFAARLVRRIIENIQLEVKDVHITLKGANCAAGLTLESLQIVTTDQTGKKVFVDRTKGPDTVERSFLHKALQIEGLGVYLDERKGLGDLNVIREEGSFDGFAHHSFLLSPLAFQARLRQADDHVCREYPKYRLDSELQSLSLSLSKAQYDLIQKIAAQMQPAAGAANPLFPEYRPLSRPTRETAKDWWQYALRCVGRLNGRRSWVEFYRAFQLRKEYIHLYKRRAHAATCSWMESLKDEEAKTLECIEADRSISIEGIMTWRNIADAQADKEREKHASQHKKGNLFGALFGGNQATEEEPPVHLSPDEMKELEAVTLDQIANAAELSRDSKLYDIRFLMQQFEIKIAGKGEQPLTALEMSTVSSDFTASADGSFNFGFAMRALSISDRVTPRTLFPKILYNKEDSEGDAFSVDMSKDEAGDQRLSVKLSTFEAVLSPLIVTELRNFLEASENLPKASKQNVVLAQSLSGSIDLFYDATEGLSSLERGATATNNQALEQNFSEKLIDAWQARASSETSFVVDLDLRAPVFVVPESCVDSKAQLLVLDLGHLRLRYGAIKGDDKIVAWFKKHPEVTEESHSTVTDYGRLTATDLALKVGLVEDCQLLSSAGSVGWGQAIIEPISVFVDLGVEAITSGAKPRLCSFIELPTIRFGMSPLQLSRAMTVSSAWRRLLEQFSAEEERLAPRPRAASDSSAASMNESPEIPISTKTSFSSSSPSSSSSSSSFIYVDARLNEFALKILTDTGSGIEARLVSVRAAYEASHENLDVRMTMGWFWVVDRFESQFARHQRLVVHSVLPVSSQDIATKWNYDVKAALEAAGKLGSSSDIPSDLADVQFKRSHVPFGDVDPFTASSLDSDRLAVEVIVDAEFSSLFVTWNPQAVKVATSAMSSFLAFLDTATCSENSGLIVAGEEHLVKQLGAEANDTDATHSGATLIRAKMGTLHLELNSARDDLRLFAVDLSAARVWFVTGGDDQKGTVSLGDFKILGAEHGKCLGLYRQLMGRERSEDQDLLTMTFGHGERIVSCHESAKERENMRSFADVSIAPVKVVYLQSQVLALTEYVTEGILGSFTAVAASTAAAAAAEVSTSSSGESMFTLRGRGLTILVPESAVSPKSFSISTGELRATHVSFPDGGGGVASVSMSDFCIVDSVGQSLQENSLSMALDVGLPPDMGKDPVQVMIDLPRMEFRLTKQHYHALMLILESNIGDEKLYLRENDAFVEIGTFAEEDAVRGESVIATLTHGGAFAVESSIAVNATVKVQVLALDLFGESNEEPLARVSGRSSTFDFSLDPASKTTSSRFVMEDLSCEDRRIESLGRDHRFLLHHNKSSDAVDAFRLQLSSNAEGATSLDFDVGSPSLVVIPDAIMALLGFVARPQADARAPTSKAIAGPSIEPEQEVRVQETEQSDGVEVSLIEKKDSSSLSLKLNTGIFSVVLVDLGTNVLVHDGGSRRMSTVAAATETLVIDGEFSAFCRMATDKDSGAISSVDFEMNCETIEAYSSSGADFGAALQILEPCKLSMYANMRVGLSGSEYDIRVASVTPLEVCCSMRNVALVHAISSSIAETFETEEPVEDVRMTLSADETAHMEKIAAALEDADTSMHADATTVVSLAPTTPVQSLELPEDRITLKATMPELSITFVNDLQGLDDALLRNTVRNLVVGARIATNRPLPRIGQTFLAFDVDVHTSIEADCFDSPSSEWKKLLTRPWELTLSASRGVSTRFSAPRPSSTMELESFPCHVSFSEQFLMRMAEAAQMWSMYSTATSHSAAPSPDATDSLLRRSMAASAVRTFVSTQPYAVENLSGMEISFETVGDVGEKRRCRPDSVEYFRFKPPRGNGKGGRRLYGQDIKTPKALNIWIGTAQFGPLSMENSDGGKNVHALDTDRYVISFLERRGKTTFLNFSSGLDILNHSSIPFDVRSIRGESIGHLSGVRGPSNAPCRTLGVPLRAAPSFQTDRTARLTLSPVLDNGDDLSGNLVIDVNPSTHSPFGHSDHEVACRQVGSDGRAHIDPLVLHAEVVYSLVQGHAIYTRVIIRPRFTISNEMPVSLDLRSPMPRLYHPARRSTGEDEATLTVAPSESIEVFTSGPSVAVTVKHTDNPVGGTSTDWMDGWIDLPLISEFKLTEPLTVQLPYRRGVDPLARASSSIGSVRIYLVQGEDSLVSLSPDELAADRGEHGHGVELVSSPKDLDKQTRKFFFASCHHAVDHVGDILFCPADVAARKSLRRSSTDLSSPRRSNMHETSIPFGAYYSKTHKGRLSFLPGAFAPLRLLHLNMSSAEGLRRSGPFRVEDISICSGGVESTPIQWEDGTPSGFFAYRELVSGWQSEVHIVPEYIVYNGSMTYEIYVHQSDGSSARVSSGAFTPLRLDTNGSIALEFESIQAKTTPILIGGLGLRMAIVKNRDGRSIGSIALQTVVGAEDSRLVVKVGELRSSIAPRTSKHDSIFKDDFIRCRVQWSELVIKLNEARQIESSEQALFEQALDQVSMTSPSGTTWMEERQKQLARGSMVSSNILTPIAKILLHRFTLDWQRVFKDPDPIGPTPPFYSPERSQFSMIVHNVQVQDVTPDSAFPVVFDSSSTEVSFFDLCIRTKGPLDAEIVLVDLIDLNLAHSQQKSDRMLLRTSEDFAWKLLDVANRITMAAAEFAGVNLELTWDEEVEGYTVSIKDKKPVDETVYTPPQSDLLLHIRRVRVSPFALRVSFRRTPQASRYRMLSGVKGAKIMNYFTRRLKFKIEDADLTFSRYEATNIKGPVDRLFEMLQTVYLSRVKLKMVTILTASSFQDWKYLAARDTGDDEYVEGDILRVTGNLAGNSAHYILKKAGRGLGSGVSNVTSTVGQGIENATALVGARSLGAGINTFVSGVGDGAGQAVSGVGTGAGHAVRGVGQGIGHTFGGITGGAMQMGKGIGKGIRQGDGSAVVSGFTDGFTSVGTGVGRGLSSVGMGVADGALSVGHGLFSGVKSVGRGIGGAVTGKKRRDSKKK